MSITKETGSYNLEIEIIAKALFDTEPGELDKFSNQLKSYGEYYKKLEYDLETKTTEYAWSGDSTWQHCSLWVETLDDVEYFHKEHDAWLQKYYFETDEWICNNEYVKKHKDGSLTRDLKKNWRDFATKIDIEEVYQH